MAVHTTHGCVCVSAHIRASSGNAPQRTHNDVTSSARVSVDMKGEQIDNRHYSFVHTTYLCNIFAM